MSIYLILLSSVLLGTKGIYLFLLLLLLFHFLYYTSLKGILISLLVMVLVYLSGIWFLNTETSKVLLSYFYSKSHEVGWLNAILSGRNYLIITAGADTLDKWNIINYFVGGQNQSLAITEMDFFDLFLFLGIIGTFVFFALYFTALFRFNILKSFNLFFIFSFFVLAFLGGHFFASAINALYLCLVSMYLYQTQKSQQSTQ